MWERTFIWSISNLFFQLEVLSYIAFQCRFTQQLVYAQQKGRERRKDS